MAQPVMPMTSSARPARNTERITNLPDKKRDAPSTMDGAAQSSCLLHPDGSLERDVRPDPDDAPRRPAAEALGIIGQMQAHHTESHIGTQCPGYVRVRAADAGELVPTVLHRQV